MNLLVDLAQFGIPTLIPVIIQTPLRGLTVWLEQQQKHQAVTKYLDLGNLKEKLDSQVNQGSRDNLVNLVNQGSLHYLKVNQDSQVNQALSLIHI